MLIHSYLPAGCKFISRLQACFSLPCDVTVPDFGDGCAGRTGAVWSLLKALLLTLAPLRAVVGSALCVWLCPVLWILVALREPFSAVWVHPSLLCSFSPLLLVEANSLAPSNCCCHWASAVVAFRIYNLTSPISFLAWCDVPLEQQHWPFTFYGFMSENLFLNVLPLAFIEGET